MSNNKTVATVIHGLTLYVGDVVIFASGVVAQLIPNASSLGEVSFANSDTYGTLLNTGEDLHHESDEVVSVLQPESNFDYKTVFNVVKHQSNNYCGGVTRIDFNTNTIKKAKLQKSIAELEKQVTEMKAQIKTL